MYSCQEKVVWLVSSKLNPVNEPIRRHTLLGPNRSKAQPPKTAKTEQSNI